MRVGQQADDARQLVAQLVAMHDHVELPMLEEVLTAVTTTQYSQCTVDCRLSSVVSQQHCGNPQCHSAQHALYSMHDTTMRGAAP